VTQEESSSLPLGERRNKSESFPKTIPRKEDIFAKIVWKEGCKKQKGAQSPITAGEEKMAGPGRALARLVIVQIGHLAIQDPLRQGTWEKKDIESKEKTKR